jgi:hypothetical protein
VDGGQELGQLAGAGGSEIGPEKENYLGTLEQVY